VADWISPDFKLTDKIKDYSGKLVNQPRGHSRVNGRWRNNQELQRGCIRAKTWAEADAMCKADGARLCSQKEVESGCARYGQCQNNHQKIWTNTPCEDAYTAQEVSNLGQKLLVATAEFHTTNAAAADGKPRKQAQKTPNRGRPYRATVVVIMHGGADSINFLVPLSQCGAKNMYADYVKLRNNPDADSTLALTANGEYASYSVQHACAGQCI
jgi:hypothetical protein